MTRYDAEAAFRAALPKVQRAVRLRRYEDAAAAERGLGPALDEVRCSPWWIDNRLLGTM